jgi:hypothetical protein
MPALTHQPIPGGGGAERVRGVPGMGLDRGLMRGRQSGRVQKPGQHSPMGWAKEEEVVSVALMIRVKP